MAFSILTGCARQDRTVQKLMDELEPWIVAILRPGPRWICQCQWRFMISVFLTVIIKKGYTGRCFFPESGEKKHVQNLWFAVKGYTWNQPSEAKKQPAIPSCRTCRWQQTCLLFDLHAPCKVFGNFPPRIWPACVCVSTEWKNRWTVADSLGNWLTEWLNGWFTWNKIEEWRKMKETYCMTTRKTEWSADCLTSEKIETSTAAAPWFGICLAKQMPQFRTNDVFFHAAVWVWATLCVLYC